MNFSAWFMFGNFGTVITTLSPKGPQVAIIFYSGLGEVLRLIPNYKLFLCYYYLAIKSPN